MEEAKIYRKNYYEKNKQKIQEYQKMYYQKYLKQRRKKDKIPHWKGEKQKGLEIITGEIIVKFD